MVIKNIEIYILVFFFCFVLFFIVVLLVAQLYPTLGNPMDCSPLPFVHEIFQARILQWVAILFLQGIFLTQGLNPHLLPWQMGCFFFLTAEPPGKPQIYMYVCIYVYISHFKSGFLNTSDRMPIINNILLYRISTKVLCVHSVET